MFRLWLEALLCRPNKRLKAASKGDVVGDWERSAREKNKSSIISIILPANGFIFSLFCFPPQNAFSKRQSRKLATAVMVLLMVKQHSHDLPATHVQKNRNWRTTLFRATVRSGTRAGLYRMVCIARTYNLQYFLRICVYRGKKSARARARCHFLELHQPHYYTDSARSWPARWLKHNTHATRTQPNARPATVHTPCVLNSEKKKTLTTNSASAHTKHTFLSVSAAA